MDEEFESFVVTDPELVDPGIDVSGLRTQTDTSLLGNIPDYAGIQYEAFNPNRLSDLMRLYSSGLPAIDTPAAAVPPATGGGGSGDGGQAAAPVDTTPIDTSIIDEGIQSAEDDKGDVMLEDFEMANMGGITSDPIQMENIASNPYDIPMNIDDPGASIENLIAQNPSGTIPGRTDIFDINQTGDPTTTMLDVPTQDVGLAYTGEFDPNDEGTVFDTSITPEDTEESITQKIADFLNVDTDKLNKAAVTSALNLVAGKALDTVIPIATVFNLVTDSFTKSPEEIAAEEQARQDNIDENKVLSEILEDEVTEQDIIDDRGRGQIPTRTEPEPTPIDRPTMADIAGPTEDQNIIDRGGGDDIGTGGLDPNRGQQVDRGSSGAGDNQPVSTTTGPPSTGFQPQSTYDAELEDDRDVGGGGNDGGGNGGGGKSIVCTAMYQTTGLEDWSKAMKIWYIYQKKYLTIEHQEGYHKLFKPFVKGMHKSSIIKAIGAHVARHRTQHLKHVMFNSKPSLLGKIYNKILEPICYFVGKHG